MSESRKSHFTVDGAPAKDEDVATYKPIPESDSVIRTSKSNLSKSKEKLSSDGAEEKLLQKEEEAKVVPRVDMDAKYVVESYTNGDAKIELDANKRQFTGLTKEELQKYVDDPFWVRLRWFMFLLFWALWLCMLAAAVVIIVQAPKCPRPEPKTWDQRGPHIDASAQELTDDMTVLPLLKDADIQGIFVKACKEAYEDKPTCLDAFKKFTTKATDSGVKVIVELTANFVRTAHQWFVASANRTSPYDSYFTWATGIRDDANNMMPPNNMLTADNQLVWSLSTTRNQFYLSQLGGDRADLDFRNTAVQAEFDKEIRQWMAAGAAGVRLHKANFLVVEGTEGVEEGVSVRSKLNDTKTQLGLEGLLSRWAAVVAESGKVNGVDETVFTLAEDGDADSEIGTHTQARASVTSSLALNVPLRPLSARALRVNTRNATQLVADLRDSVAKWPLLQLESHAGNSEEVLALSMALPAAPVFTIDQLYHSENHSRVSDAMKRLAPMRRDASVEHGSWYLEALNSTDNDTQVVACARWKKGHTAYLVLYNPSDAQTAVVNVRGVKTVPDSVTVHYVSESVTKLSNYTDGASVSIDKVVVPPLSSVVLSYAPHIEETS